MPGSIPALCHEELHIYQAAIEFLSLAEDVAGNLARGNAAIVDQLRRSRPRASRRCFGRAASLSGRRCT